MVSVLAITGGEAILQTSSTTSTSQITSVSGAALFVVAWLICAILIGAGVITKKTWLLNWGIVAVGIMTIVTPLVSYISEALRLGAFEASIQDFLVLASLSALGGGIITFGILRLRKRGLPTKSA